MSLWAAPEQPIFTISGQIVNGIFVNEHAALCFYATAHVAMGLGLEQNHRSYWSFTTNMSNTTENLGQEFPTDYI